ncbi:MAG: crossover junction endodeoxyribonuclease RuvC [Bacteroidetes bacterium GWA2_30_7]|nr:MAG: crossover junction endodeoxyribonuclease RuvC [Bacteroidetes bacterium GWA2_30_7]
MNIKHQTSNIKQSIAYANRVILGIDPGTIIMGYGIIEIINNSPKLISIGHIEINKFQDHYLRLKYIFEKTMSLINQYVPDELAIEAPFYGNNVQSMLKLGRAQGAAISAALTRDIPITEYAPRKIKLSITGSGSASKEQVAIMLSKILNMEKLPSKLDATDGLAVALCHFYQSKVVGGKSAVKNWKEFISKNPDKVL